MANDKSDHSIERRAAEEAVRRLLSRITDLGAGIKLSHRASVVWLVSAFEAQVNNGGIDQVLYNSTGD